ncbi:MAG: signal peptidase II [Acidobacteriota bacterium]|nr:signal peptidase II [Acidobacteriota bacterium]MDH3524873.1 signal peptidase II [Acidobacteriota bacterium]
MTAPKVRLLAVSAAVALLDGITKAWVVAHVLPYETIAVVPGFVNLTHVRNRGVAFGLFNRLGDFGPPVLIAAGAIALVVVGVYFRRTAREERLLLWSLALILGGAVGNLADRIAHGAVTDFVDVFVGAYHWHTFNVADSAITVGICLMLLDVLRERRRRPAE